jgi:hypothetical protein
VRAVVFDAQDAERRAHEPAVAASVATGVLADAIVLDGSRGTEFFALSPATVTWLGAPAWPAALRPGDPLVIRHRAPAPDPPGRRLAERIWPTVASWSASAFSTPAPPPPPSATRYSSLTPYKKNSRQKNKADNPAERSVA